MKRWIFAVAVVFSSFLAACSNPPQQAGKKVSAEEVKRKDREAYEVTKTYTLQQKDEYEKQVEAKLKEWDKQLEERAAEAKKKTGEARRQYETNSKELQKKRDAAQKELDGLKSATEDTWEKVKAGVNSAMDDLRDSYERMRGGSK